jgi:hypothetical protein
MNAAQIETICQIAEAAGFSGAYCEKTDIFTFTDQESGIEIISVLQGDEDAETRILFNQMKVCELDLATISSVNGLFSEMLNVDNDISTSSFKAASVNEGDSVAILLTNYATLQNLNQDDAADITFCLQALIADAAAASEMLRKYMMKSACAR